MVAQTQAQGLGNTVKSWVGNGPNLSISAAQVQATFGAGRIAALAAKVGLNPHDPADKLAQALSQAIN